MWFPPGEIMSHEVVNVSKNISVLSQWGRWQESWHVLYDLETIWMNLCLMVELDKVLRLYRLSGLVKWAIAVHVWNFCIMHGALGLQTWYGHQTIGLLTMSFTPGFARVPAPAAVTCLPLSLFSMKDIVSSAFRLHPPQKKTQKTKLQICYPDCKKHQLTIMRPLSSPETPIN